MRFLIQTVQILPFLLIFSFSAYSQTYYVGPNGNNFNTGTEINPWKNIQYALDRAQSGDTIYVRAGTFNEYLVFQSSGVILSGYAGETVILDGTGLNWRYGIDLSNYDNITVGNLTIREYSRDGAYDGYGVVGWSDNDNITLRNLIISKVGAAIKFQANFDPPPPTATDLLMENITASEYTTGIDLGPAAVQNVTIRNVHLMGPGGSGETYIDGIAVESGQNILVEDSVVADHPGDGIDLKANDVTVRRVKVMNQGRDGVKLWGTHTTLEKSLIVGSGLTSLVLEGAGPYTIVNNTIGNSQLYGYTATLGPYGSSATSQMTFLNNIFFNLVPSNGGTLLYFSSGCVVNAQGNLFYQPYREDSVIDASYMNQTFGVQEFNQNQWPTGFSNNFYGNPNFVGPEDFNLQSTSPAIDVGVNGEDIGAYAFDESSVSTPNANSPLGINLAALEYWSTEWTLVDLFKSSGGWYTQKTDWTWNTLEQNKLDLDANGWVRSLPAANDTTVQYRTVGAFIRGHAGAGNYPAGQYTVLYDGEGTIIYPFGAVKNVALSGPGKDVLDVTSTSDGFLLRITSTDPNKTGNHIRNIRVLMPDTTENQRFHPQFLNDIEKYRVLRFMQFFNITYQPTGTWDQRTQMTDARWRSPNGAPIELALELCNTNNSDCWLNIPFSADDNYVRNFSILAKQMLKPNLKVYLEYTNEAWNFAYPYNIGMQWMQQKAQEAWPNDPSSAFVKGLNWYAKRSVEIFNIWRQEWGNESARVKGVLAGQSGWEYVNRQMLDCPIWVANGGSPCAASADYFSTTPYIGFPLRQSNVAMVRSWMQEADGGYNSLFQYLQTQTLPSVYQMMSSNAATAASHNLPLISYEGGQHLVVMPELWNEPDATNLINFFAYANRDPRMGQIYSEYLNEWKNRGGTLFTHYMSVQKYGQYGYWGSKEVQSQASTPKFDALMKFIDDNPCWWDGCSLPDPQPPTARAGIDQTVTEGDSVLLDGSASSDPEEKPLSFSWSQLSGPIVSLSDPNAAFTSFKAPEIDDDSMLQFELTVTDSDGLSSSSIVTILVQDNPVYILDYTFDSSSDLSQFTISGSSQITWSILNGALTAAAKSSPTGVSWITPKNLNLSGLSQFIISFDHTLYTSKSYLNILGVRVDLYRMGILDQSPTFMATPLSTYKKYHFLVYLIRGNPYHRLKIWVNGKLLLNELMEAPYTTNTISFGTGGRVLYDNMKLTDVPNPRIYPFLWNFQNGWGYFGSWGDKNILWKVYPSSQMLQASASTLAKKSGFTFLLPANVSSGDVLLQTQIRYPTSYNQGGFWVGRSFDLNPTRIAPTGSTGPSFGKLSVGAWHDIVLILRRGTSLTWSAWINGQWRVQNEPLEGTADGKIGFYSSPKGTVQFKDMALHLAPINGNLPPTLRSIKDQSVKVDNTITIQLQAMDPEGQTLTFSSNSSSANIPQINSGGLFTWTPGAGDVGVHTVNFQVSDGEKASQKTMKIAVVMDNV